MFRSFEKRLVRSASSQVFGFNFQSMSFVTGPRLLRITQSGSELLFDYAKYRAQATCPPTGPKVVPNDRGFSNLVYKNLHDFCRRVSRDVVIGHATETESHCRSTLCSRGSSANSPGYVAEDSARGGHAANRRKSASVRIPINAPETTGRQPYLCRSRSAPRRQPDIWRRRQHVFDHHHLDRDVVRRRKLASLPGLRGSPTPQAAFGASPVQQGAHRHRRRAGR